MENKVEEEQVGSVSAERDRETHLYQQWHLPQGQLSPQPFPFPLFLPGNF